MNKYVASFVLTKNVHYIVEANNKEEVLNTAITLLETEYDSETHTHHFYNMIELPND